MIRRPLAFGVALCIVVAAFVAGAALTQMHRAPAAAQAYPRAVSLAPDALLAQAAVLYDATSGRILYQKNASTQLPLASLTKLVTAQTVLSRRDPSTVVTITPADLKPEGGGGLEAGDTLTLDALLRFGLVASNNDAMAAAASSLGDNYLSALNQTAQTLNLTKTYFLNPTGLDLTDETSGAYGSAYDVARLAAAFYKNHPAYFELTTYPDVSIQDGSRTLTAAATAKPLQDIPGFVGAKTGYTDLAGGNLAAIFDLEPGRPVVAVVLHSTEPGRFSDIKTLIDAVRAQNP